MRVPHERAREYARLHPERLRGRKAPKNDNDIDRAGGKK